MDSGEDVLARPHRHTVLVIAFACLVACGRGEPEHRVLVDGKPETLVESEVRGRLHSGALTETSQVWVDGHWTLLKDVPALRDLAAATRAAATPAPAPAGPAAVPVVTRVAMALVPEAFPLGLSTENGRGSSLAELPDESFRVLPARTGERFFGTLWFGDRSVFVVLESGEGGRPARLYLDRNGDGDLTNDPGPFSPEGQGALPAFYTIQLPWVEEAGDATLYRMWWFPSNMGGTAFYAACHRAGRFPYGDVPMVLFDTNADGDYSNDPLYIDWNRNEKADPDEAYLRGEPIPVGSGSVRCEFISRGGAQVGFAS